MPVIISVADFGPGPGLYFDLAMLSFHVPSIMSVWAEAAMAQSHGKTECERARQHSRAHGLPL